MAIEIRQLRYAVVAAQTLSFSHAARILKVKQSTLSKRILVLEQRLGIILFERSTRGAFPTKAGADFLNAASRIVGDIDNLRNTARAINRGEAGSLMIGFCSSLSAGNLRVTVADYMERFPAVRLSGVEGARERLLQGLKSRAIDVAILTDNLIEPGFAKRLLWSERILVALPEEHHLTKAERIYWPDLRHETFLLPSQHGGPEIAEILIARFVEPGQKPNIVLQDISRENVLNMISLSGHISLTSEAGIGVAHRGVVLRDVYDLTGHARVELAAYWREGNDNRALQRFFGLISERYPG